MMSERVIILLILLANSLLWVRSSFGKVTEGKFVSGLGGTLTKFASNNPYPFVKDFLQSVAIPNSILFGNLTMWGEVLVAISTIIAVLYLLFQQKSNNLIKLMLVVGLLGGIFLNLIFWSSAGWTSSSTESLNLLMMVVQFFGLIFALRLK